MNRRTVENERARLVYSILRLTADFENFKVDRRKNGALALPVFPAGTVIYLQEATGKVGMDAGVASYVARIGEDILPWEVARALSTFEKVVPHEAVTLDDLLFLANCLHSPRYVLTSLLESGQVTPEMIMGAVGASR